LNTFGRHIPDDGFSNVHCPVKNGLTNGGTTAMPIEAAVDNHELEAVSSMDTWINMRKERVTAQRTAA